MSRLDKRNNLELLPLIIQRDIKPNCTNSVYIENNSIKLLCAITGPYYSSQKSSNDSKMDLNISIKIPSYCSHQKSKINSYKESQLVDILSKHLIISKYPRTRLDIVIEVFEYKCDYFPFAVMGVSLCANYANIEQKGVLSCCNIIIDDKQNIIADPTIEEELNALTKLTVGCNIFLKENFMYTQNGKCDSELLKHAIATSIKICESYHNLLLTKL